MFEVITFGSVTYDLFFKVPKEQIIKTKDLASGCGVCFNLGSKFDIKEMYFSFGGGGMNTAATFKKQGFNVAYCGSVGDDISGKEIVAQFEEMGVDTRFVQKNDMPTNCSVILNTSEEDRTVLTYRGASELLNKEEILWGDMDCSWFYLAPLSGKLSDLTEDIIDFAHKNKIKTAVNLGNSQIALGTERLKEVLKKADVLLLNLEEASLLTGIEAIDEMGIARELNTIHKGINVVTKGAEGVFVSYEEYLYDANSVKMKIVDKTGAGDAFSSGFVSGLIKSNMDLEWAIKLGIANSVSCIQVKGAINGLLEGSDNMEEIGSKVKIKKIKIV
jgi:sugar/nucleoside kinase (ribokinase family)